jgi:hypothetical protein
MKKLWLVLLLAAAGLVMTGCGGGSGTGEETGGNPDDPLVIYDNGTWGSGITADIETTATGDPHIIITFTGGLIDISGFSAMKFDFTPGGNFDPRSYIGWAIAGPGHKEIQHWGGGNIAREDPPDSGTLVIANPRVKAFTSTSVTIDISNFPGTEMNSINYCSNRATANKFVVKEDLVKVTLLAE